MPLSRQTHFVCIGLTMHVFGYLCIKSSEIFIFSMCLHRILKWLPHCFSLKINILLNLKLAYFNAVGHIPPPCQFIYKPCR